MNKDNWGFIKVMLFYIILSYVVLPGIFYYVSGGSLLRAGDGSAVGNILSVVLWYTYGSKMVK